MKRYNFWRRTDPSNWRDDRPTEAQLTAINNMCNKFFLTIRKVRTKGEACDEIQRLIDVIAEIKRTSYSQNTEDREWDNEFRHAFDL